MKKYLLLGTLIAIIPNCVFGHSARYNQLVAEKQQKVKELEDCTGNVKAWKIAGISTIGLTVVGIAGNIVLANKQSQYDDKIANAKKQIDSTQESIEKKELEIAQHEDERRRQQFGQNQSKGGSVQGQQSSGQTQSGQTSNAQNNGQNSGSASGAQGQSGGTSSIDTSQKNQGENQSGQTQSIQTSNTLNNNQNSGSASVSQGQSGGTSSVDTSQQNQVENQAEQTQTTQTNNTMSSLDSDNSNINPSSSSSSFNTDNSCNTKKYGVLQSAEKRDNIGIQICNKERAKILNRSVGVYTWTLYCDNGQKVCKPYSCINDKYDLINNECIKKTKQ